MSTLNNTTSTAVGTTFAKRIKALRDERKVLQADLARALEISRPTLSAYENGSTLPTIDVVYRAAEFFDVTCDYLLGRDMGKDPEKTAFIEKTGLSDRATDALFRISDIPEAIYPQYDFVSPSRALSELLETPDGEEIFNLISRLLMMVEIPKEYFEPHEHIKPLYGDHESFWEAYQSEQCHLAASFDDSCNFGNIYTEIRAEDILLSCIEKRLRDAIEDIRSGKEWKQERYRSLVYRYHDMPIEFGYSPENASAHESNHIEHIDESEATSEM